MQDNKSNLFTLAKYINKELLVEEMFYFKGLAATTYLSNLNKNRRIIKVKTVAIKVFYSIIFGILPLVPLMTYFEMNREIVAEGLPVNVIIYGCSILYIFFFIMQFLNIFFMALIEVGLIMSNKLFLWLETLPLSKKNLRNLKLISIFRYFDMPIVVIALAFPIVMYIGTSNFIIFLICLGISILHIILSLSILLLIGDKMARILEINTATSRKAMIIRLINIFGYVIVFFGSLIFVQWAMNSIDTFFRFPMVQQNPAILNLILCTIPYPFASCYLISFITTTTQIHFHYWIGIICGIGLLIIFTWWISKKSLKGLDRISSPKGESIKKYKRKQILKKKIQIKIRKPFHAHLIKDLSITSRNLKVFLSAITPILFSFIFTFTLNSTILGSQNPLTTDFFYNWSVILAFQPVICGMIIYNLMNIEDSGESILTVLPTNPKIQAKAKILLFIIIQTISVISPYLIFIFHPKFIELLITVLISLPSAWFVLLSMFEMYVFFFGRKNYRFVLETIHPENKSMKWAFIYIFQFSFYLFLVSSGIILNYIREQFFTISIILITIICYLVLFIVFKTMFNPNLNPREKKQFDSIIDKNKFILNNRFDFFIKNPKLSISLLLSSNFFFVSLINFYLLFLNQITSRNFYIILYWFGLFLTLLLIIIRTDFIPKYINNYYNKFKNSNYVLRIIKLGIFGVILVNLFHYFFILTLAIPFSAENIQNLLESVNYDLYGIFAILIFAIWHEMLFRGIILPILLTRYKEFISMFINTGIFLFYFLIYSLLLSFILDRLDLLILIFLNMLYLFCINLFLAYLFLKTNNVFPALIIHFITILLNILPFFYFGMHIFFSDIFI